MNQAAVQAGAVVVAFALDQLFGEPPAHSHPVVWMGSALTASGAPWERLSPRGQFICGVLAWIIGCAAVVAVATLAVELLRRIPLIAPWSMLIQVLMLGILLKPLLAWRMLRDEVAGVERALAIGLDAGRQQLSRLVSRDTRQLSEGELRESALESLAENLNDSLIAPLFWFTCGGLPGAALYRFANTVDAMWGYRGRWEWAGKWAARADDMLSYIPARLTALLLALSGRRTLRGLAAVASVTPSPNSGWPMGMLALALNVRLTKPGVYALNPKGASPRPEDMARGLAICSRAAWLSVALSTAVLAPLGARP